MLRELLQTLRGGGHASPTEAAEALRRRLDMELTATLYCYANRSYLVTSIMTAPLEMMVEIGEPTVLPIGITDAELGATALHHLAQMVRRRPPNQRERKLTDWRVYQLSGARSVRSFASHSLTVMFETSPAGISLSARGTHVVEGMPWATATTSTDATALGAAIRQVIAAAQAAVA